MPRSCFAASASSSGQAAGQPKMSIGSTPAVRSVTAAAAASGSMSSVSGSTSTKTGFAPS